MSMIKDVVLKLSNSASDINSHVWWLGPRLARFPIPLLLWYYIQYFRVSRKFFHEREKRETVSYDLWHYLVRVYLHAPRYGVDHTT